MDALLAWKDEHINRAPAHSAGEAIHEEVWLLGQPPLRKYLDFVTDVSVGGADMAPSLLVDEWRTANDYYAELEAREAGIADTIGIGELDEALKPLAEEIMTDARWTRAFTTLPTRFAMVELDRLVVSQPFVNLSHAARLQEQLGRSPSAESLFKFCLPLARTEAPVRMRRAGTNRFLFWSESSDFRFHEPVRLRPEQIVDYTPFGPIGGVIGLTVGYGSNFLNLIESDGRLLIHNGYHRAYSLRALGITHAPAIVQTVTRRDELHLVASRSVLEDPLFYFKAPRPPILKDFFDPKIRKVLRVPKVLRMIELSFEVNEIEIVDFANEG
jgi:hypothetical protein